jgi:hypothetical protein
MGIPSACLDRDRIARLRKNGVPAALCDQLSKHAERSRRKLTSAQRRSLAKAGMMGARSSINARARLDRIEWNNRHPFGFELLPEDRRALSQNTIARLAHARAEFDRDHE